MKHIWKNPVPSKGLSAPVLKTITARMYSQTYFYMNLVHDTTGGTYDATNIRHLSVYEVIYHG